MYVGWKDSIYICSSNGIIIHFAFPRKTSNVMMTQPSPRYLIDFGITPAPSTEINSRSLRSFRSCLQVDPCWFTSMQGFGRNGPRSKSGRMIPFYFPTWPTNPLLGRL